MEKFAVKVDLSAFFDNIYEKVIILVDPKWLNVLTLEQKITKMFNIKRSIIFKTDDGFYIPSEEAIEIVKYVNILVAIKKKKGSPQEPSESEHKTENEDSAMSVSEPKLTKAKKIKNKRSHMHMEEAQFTTSTPTVTNLAKRLKGSDGNATTQAADANQMLNFEKNSSEEQSLSMDPLKNRKFKKASKKSLREGSRLESQTEKLISNQEIQNEATSQSTSKCDDLEKIEDSNRNIEDSKAEIVFSCDLENLLNKNGRIFRIDRPAPETAEDKKEIKGNERPIILRNETLVKGATNDSVDNYNKTSNGIENSKASNQSFISDTNGKANRECYSDLENSLNKNGRIFRNDRTAPKTIEDKKEIKSNERPIIPRNETLVEDATNDSVDSYNKTSNETESSKAWSQSFISDTNGTANREIAASTTQMNETSESFIACDDSAVIEVNETRKESISINEKEEGLSKSIILSKSKDLTELPNIGDYILFKIPLVNKKISDEMIGICEYINKRTKTMKLQVVDATLPRDNLPSKYQCNIDDSMESPCIKVKISDLIEPKLLGVS